MRLALGVKKKNLHVFYLFNLAPEFIYQSMNKFGIDAGQGTKNGV